MICGKGKYSMPHRSGVVSSIYMTDYSPPSIAIDYSGHIPKMAFTIGMTSGKAMKKCILKKHEEENEGHEEPFIYNQSSSNTVPHRKSFLQNTAGKRPAVFPANFDESSYCCVEDFYKSYQNHRDYYLSRSRKVLPECMFMKTPNIGKCPADDRAFKIGKKPEFNMAQFLQCTSRCSNMPCIKHRRLLFPFKVGSVVSANMICGSGKGIMPRQEVDNSIYMTDYSPPSIPTDYSGHIPEVAFTVGMTFGTAMKKCILKKHEEDLKTERKPFIYNRSSLKAYPAIPHRKSFLRDAPGKRPPVFPGSIDQNFYCCLEDLYKSYQNHRDYYLSKSRNILPDCMLMKSHKVAKCSADDSILKIGKKPEVSMAKFLQCTSKCSEMQCIKHRRLMFPFKVPLPSRSPFQCSS